MFYRRRPSERSGVWNLYAPMLWLFLASAVLGMIAWATYLRNIVYISDYAVSLTPFLASSIIKDAFIQLYPVVLITCVLTRNEQCKCNNRCLILWILSYSLHFAAGSFGMLFVLHRFVSVAVCTFALSACVIVTLCSGSPRRAQSCLVWSRVKACCSSLGHSLYLRIYLRLLCGRFDIARRLHDASSSQRWRNRGHKVV